MKYYRHSGDIDTDDFIGEVCEDLQRGDTITFDVTTAIDHDLYDPDQTIFSGFIIFLFGFSLTRFLKYIFSMLIRTDFVFYWS